MADNYLQFSEQIINLTQEEIAWLTLVLVHVEDLQEGNTVAESFFEEHNRDLDLECFPDFQWGIDEKEKTFWFYSDSYGNFDHILTLLQDFLKKFRPTEVFMLTYAETCSKMRIGEFSGGAAVVSAKEILVMNAIDWADAEGKRLKKKMDPYKKDA